MTDARSAAASLVARPAAAVHVLGGGLAGTEAAWQAARHGVRVVLHEMRPAQLTPAHRTGQLAELVCSNSFGARAPDRAAGLLQEELRRLGSLVIRKADEHAVPAGGALAVDRLRFAEDLTGAVAGHPEIELRREEVRDLPERGPAVIATGPLTAAGLAASLQRFTGLEYLSFFDAASPIVEGDSLDHGLLYRASRYDRGEAAYLNSPMDRAQYLRFREALCGAEQAELHAFERTSARFFEACLPIEELARRGEDTMRFGPLKPVGLERPDLRDARGRALRPYAVVQLRAEDREGRLFNLVGFQTNLRWSEQQRVFRMIPGLERAEFARLGVMHRNTFLNAPELLAPTLQFRRRPDLLAAGQLTGTEGYAAAVAGGWLAGTNAARLALGLEPLALPPATLSGALLAFVSSAAPRDFQPMPPNLGLLPALERPPRNKRERHAALGGRALDVLDRWRAAIGRGSRADSVL
ncbi:MAG: FADH(2)-oxidizing methylenetetrahydrofolate--tRNA-(uracil(54)-C(5))-methyltransferase TrmFO [Planctomycetes bacterium]|nr:FADH(2)-oxidizing methylenetetrahydrofolate--tRNA-(uracil(54)-C(5))-methyltransferase TrmFO [Planctomycetota bacterium]